MMLASGICHLVRPLARCGTLRRAFQSVSAPMAKICTKETQKSEEEALAALSQTTMSPVRQWIHQRGRPDLDVRQRMPERQTVVRQSSSDFSSVSFQTRHVRVMARPMWSNEFSVPQESLVEAEVHVNTDSATIEVEKASKWNKEVQPASSQTAMSDVRRWIHERRRPDWFVRESFSHVGQHRPDKQWNDTYESIKYLFAGHSDRLDKRLELASSVEWQWKQLKRKLTPSQKCLY